VDVEEEVGVAGHPKQAPPPAEEVPLKSACGQKGTSLCWGGSGVCVAFRLRQQVIAHAVSIMGLARGQALSAGECVLPAR
jgi:hypothetical protein